MKRVIVNVLAGIVVTVSIVWFVWSFLDIATEDPAFVGHSTNGGL